MRIGIDVGGTHTDAVILNGDEIVASTKSLTSSDVVSGVTSALDAVLDDAQIGASAVSSIMIGTTQFTNAIVERRNLSRVAALRVGLPSGDGIPPMYGWPDDLVAAINAKTYMLHGGFLYNGWPLAELQQSEIDSVIADLIEHDIRNIVVSSAFSTMNADHEVAIATKVKKAIPDALITLSNSFGRLGLMERENASIMNAALKPLASQVVDAFLTALERRKLSCPIFISQNDGTLMSCDFVRDYPALTFASGPTNSLRGAFKLTGLEDAIVIDIGGTTSDIGVLQSGFPRESNVVVDVGGVRTNFRMPDILALGLGGGSLVSEDGSIVGPQSLGHRLVESGFVFGGNTLTSTDILVASGAANIGDSSRMEWIDPAVVATAQQTMKRLLNQGVEMMKPGGRDLPVILVGGGAVLVTGALDAASEIYRPENAGVANAIGAAIAQVGAEAEQMVSYRVTAREEAIKRVTEEATKRAVAAGAKPESINAVDIEEIAIPYMDEGGTRVRVKVIGDLNLGAGL